MHLSLTAAAAPAEKRITCHWRNWDSHTPHSLTSADAAACSAACVLRLPKQAAPLTHLPQTVCVTRLIYTDEWTAARDMFTVTASTAGDMV